MTYCSFNKISEDEKKKKGNPELLQYRSYWLFARLRSVKKYIPQSFSIFNMLDLAYDSSFLKFLYLIYKYMLN